MRWAWLCLAAAAFSVFELQPFTHEEFALNVLKGKGKNYH